MTPLIRHGLFDLNGTMVDPRAMADPLGGDAEARALIDGALSDAVHAAAVETIAGSHADFAARMRAVLRRRLALAEREEALERVMEAMGHMPPFPDAAGAIELLSHA